MRQATTLQRTKPGPKARSRLSFAELEEFLHGSDHWMRQYDSTGIDDDRVMPGYIAHVCGVSRGVVHTWRNRDLSLNQADQAACALGVHPMTIWPHWGREED